MTTSTIGNMSQLFLTQQQNFMLRSRLSDLTSELSSGRESDLTKALGTDTARFSHIDRRLGMLQAYTTSAVEASQELVIVQQVLGTVADLRGKLSSDLVAADFSDSPAQRESRMREARSVFESMIGTLNARFADRNVMSGNASDQTPFAPTSDILASLDAAVAGLNDLSDIQAALDTWFDDPAGGFYADAYVGDTGSLATRKIDETETITFHARADAQEIRDVLKGVALAFVGENLLLSDNTEASLLREAGMNLIDVGEPLFHLASRVGSVEARIEDIKVRHQSEQASLSTLYNDMVAIDPYQTASELQELQLQLETHYTLTARMARLSLTEYLR